MIVHIDKYSIQTIMNMELNIDDEWSEFLSITDGSPTPNNERAVELPIQSSTECPKASDIYISTKTNIAYLNIPVNLTDMFWKIPVIGYGMPSEGVVKKQMKFNLTTREELEQLQNNLNVLIVGKCDEYVLRIIYQFLKKILAIEFTQIGVKIVNSEASSKQQTKKIRRKIINV